MKLSFKYIIASTNNIQSQIIDELLWHSTKIYNILLYELKENKRRINTNHSINLISTPIYREYRKENWHSKYMHSHTLQEIIINVIQNYKAYEHAIRDYNNKNNNKYNGIPKVPKYKKENKQEIVFTKYAIRIENNVIKLSLSKEMRLKFKVESLNFLIPSKLRKLINFKSIKMIKIVKNTKKIEMNIIYEKEEKELKNYNNVMAIDLGLNNIVACTNLENTNILLISGGECKSKNKYIQEKISILQRINKLSKQNKNKNKVKNTKTINKLYEYRKNYMNTYMHKASKMIIDYAKENKCGTIVIGDIKSIKQNMDYNSNFVQIPLQNLVIKIEYKAKLNGIKVEKITEEYTSGISALDNEEIKKENYNKKRRVTRGMFITNKGIKINADINGSLNILRKYIKLSIPNLEIAMGNGREQRPLKKRVA